MRHLTVLFLATVLGSPAIGATDSIVAKRDTTPKAAIVPLEPTWMAASKSAVLPGWGQFQTGHTIRGSVLMVLDLWLYSDAAFRTWSAIPKLNDKVTNQVQKCQNQITLISVWQDSTNARINLFKADSARTNIDTSALLPWDRRVIQEAKDSVTNQSVRLTSLRDSLSILHGRARVSADYRNGEIAWAIGLHLYAITDAAEEAWLASGGKRPITEMSSAIWRSILIPGWGQIYNGHYSKAALLYMGIAGSVTSYFSRQEMVEFWENETQIAIDENRSTATTKQQTEFFRKRRNQYIWGLGVVYIYQVIDAAVDARLSRFGRNFPIELEPQIMQPGLTASLRF